MSHISEQSQLFGKMVYTIPYNVMKGGSARNKEIRNKDGGTHNRYNENSEQNNGRQS